MADGTGVPGRKSELQGVAGKQPDGSAKTFEAKVGVCFAVSVGDDGLPVRDARGPAGYVATSERVDGFESQLRNLAERRDVENASAIVFVGDGARWIWSVQERLFPDAIAVVDLYHALEHVTDTVKLLRFRGPGCRERRLSFSERCAGLLRNGRVLEMISLVRSAPGGTAKEVTKELKYFANNVDRMNYRLFAELNLFVGSGVMEAGCKVIVGNRMKCAGMHWAKRHAENMLALRCAIRNGEYLDGGFLKTSSAA
jgi:hypothetical protein